MLERVNGFVCRKTQESRGDTKSAVPAKPPQPTSDPFQTRS